ncbi:MAG: hypothetical protein EPO07_17480 [Verrucomicrobia bacterium]|nr:MAG: hypothetical protein EPO07_17480 [Verrucomicrobiota bacterium]
MKFLSSSAWLCVVVLLAPGLAARAGNSLHTTWLWHLHQPVYWPDKRAGSEHYENAWDTIQQQDAGRPHPSPEILRNIFGLDDRRTAYQSGPRNSLSTITAYSKAGVQVSYSGALMENVQSLGSAGQLGYGSGWFNGNREARGWTTSGGKPRMDLVNFTYHHALAPLLSDETLEMELKIHKREMEIMWTTTPSVSRGYFPAETCFTERMIPILKKVGIDWSIIANTHLARACADFPVVLGSGGENCDIPNRADQLNPAQGAGNYQRISIERGCAPTQVMPFGFQLHYARYVDPETGAGTNLIVVPSDQVTGWRDSYSSWDLHLLDALAARNDASKPALVLCAHDGDNAWSGGYSYYQEWVSNMASQSSGLGYEPTTVEQFIADHPPDANDVVHVEDGGWVFADGDFGSPIFANWHWPPGHAVNGVNEVDPSVGVSDKADNWRVIIATENRVKTAQQISAATPRVDQVRDPGSFSTTPNAVELGWHYYLGSLDSGFVYYGCHDDECQRAVAAQSNAVRNVNSILTGNPAADTTPPTVFIPQRHPWNPGGTNFGVQYGYRVTAAANSDFWIWTYAYDVSGVTNVSLKLRINGTNPPTSDQFKTYAGGGLTGAWQTSNMTQRVVAPVIGVTPQYIADYFYAKVSGVTNSYVDYYVAATDARGNIFKSPIQHVWVGANLSGGGGGSTNGCNGRVCVAPVPPAQGNNITISYDASSGPIPGANPVKIHLGWNNWTSVASPDPTMISNALTARWEFTTNVPGTATQLDCVFNNGNNVWDNNSSQDWHFAVVTNGSPQAPATPTGLTATAAGSNQINLSWSASAGATGYIVQRANSTLATTAATSFSDGGLLPNTAYCYSIIATNSVGNSAATTGQCATTLAVTTNFPAFVMDGAADFAGYLVSSNGLTLYAALRGTKLYVASASPGTSGANDHFIFVSDQLLASASAAAPWAKAGLVAVAATKPFLATESQNSYLAWYNAPAGSTNAKSASTSGVLEGVIDVAAAFGAMPTNIYLCAAAYATADGGALANQSPAGSGPNIDTNEFFVIPVTALRDHNGDGKFDRLDPALDFKLSSLQSAPASLTHQWNVMPGRTYQLEFVNTLGSTWSNSAGALTTAGPMQLEIGFTTPVTNSPPTRFYRLKLLP